MFTKPLNYFGVTSLTQSINIFIQCKSQELLFMMKLFECLSPSFVFPGVQGWSIVIIGCRGVSRPWAEPKLDVFMIVATSFACLPSLSRVYKNNNLKRTRVQILVQFFEKIWNAI